MKIIKLCACLILLHFSVACADQAKPVLPVIQLRMDAPVREVQAKSSYQFDQKFLKGVPGKEYITTPHVLFYKDTDLEFRVEKKGDIRSLATYLGYEIRHFEGAPESLISHFSFFPIDDYVDAHTAVEQIKKFRDVFISQGFISTDKPWLDSYVISSEQPQKYLTSLEGLESLFLNSQSYVKQIRAVVLKKNSIEIKIDIVNLRRKYGSRTDADDKDYAPTEDRIAREIRSLTPAELKTEPSYSVNIIFEPTRERSNQRSEEIDMLRRAEEK